MAKTPLLVQGDRNAETTAANGIPRTMEKAEAALDKKKDTKKDSFRLFLVTFEGCLSFKMKFEMVIIWRSVLNFFLKIELPTLMDLPR